jgi:aryl-alcohol dehydrogenase-like predicted oxidoreductase
MFRLALGTVQFGMHYGITNRTGVPDAAQLAQILDWAMTQDIGDLDTASAYGDAHQRLGEYGVRDFRVVSKMPARIEPYAMEACLVKILSQLRINRLFGLLLHAQEDLLDAQADARFAQLKRLQAAGLINRIGISAYDGEALLQICERFPIDMVQCPVNPLNRSCEAALQWLAKNRPEVEIHLRSIFLQGALLSAPESLPQHLQDLRKGVTQYQDACRRQNVPPGVAALAYLRRFDPEVAVVGVSHLAELQEIADWHKAAAEVNVDLPEIPFVPEFDPRAW